MKSVSGFVRKENHRHRNPCEKGCENQNKTIFSWLVGTALEGPGGGDEFRDSMEWTSENQRDTYRSLKTGNRH